MLGVGGDQGEFHRFCEDYRLDPICFTPEHIHQIGGPDGPFINDTESAEHNTVTADFITEQVRRFTEDDQAARSTFPWPEAARPCPIMRAMP